MRKKENSSIKWFIKRTTVLFFLLVKFSGFSQETITKLFTSHAKLIEISTDGLDVLKIVNSNTDKVEVNLFDENPHSHHILVDDKTSILKIGFKLNFKEEESVFRKYITKRLNRVSVTVKLPKNMDVTILGTTIDVISNNYNGNLNIYIDKGFVNLHKVQQNAFLNLFQGNIFATISNSNTNVETTNGKILINKKLHLKKYKKVTENAVKTFSVTSINANVNLSTL